MLVELGQPPCVYICEFGLRLLLNLLVPLRLSSAMENKSASVCAESGLGFELLDFSE